MNSREFQIEIKKLSDEGTFEGLGAVYGNVDQGGDRIEPGAFRKTLLEKGGRVPLLADHRTPIGAAFVTENPAGLWVRGELNLEKQSAQETLSDLRFFRDKKIPYGMSIGYQTVKSERIGDVRVLKELKLSEMSVTLFPMNDQATVQSVKHNHAETSDAVKWQISNLVREAYGKKTLTFSEWETLEQFKTEFSALIKSTR